MRIKLDEVTRDQKAMIMINDNSFDMIKREFGNNEGFFKLANLAKLR